MDNAAYNEFLRAKMNLTEDTGVECDTSEINPLCKPHQVDVTAWGVRGGRRAYFAAFGLGTVVLRAVKLGRTGVGIELNANYHKDGVYWLRRGEGEARMPSLFDTVGVR